MGTTPTSQDQDHTS